MLSSKPLRFIVSALFLPGILFYAVQVPKNLGAQSDEPLAAPAEPILLPNEMTQGTTGGEQPPEGAGPVAAGDAGAVMEERSIFVRGMTDPFVAFDQKWQQRKQVLANSSLEVADNFLPDLLESRLDLGVVNLTPYSEVLIRESESAFAKRDKKRALRLAEIASGLSPDSPRAHFFYAKITFLVNPLDWRFYSRALEGFAVYGRSLPHSLRYAGNFLLTTGAVLWGAILMTCVLLFLKYQSIFTHVLEHMFLQKVSRRAIRYFAYGIFLIPFVLKAGMGWIVIIFSLSFLCIVSKHERVLLGLTMLVILAIPLLLASPLSGLLTAHAETDFVLFKAMNNELAAHELRTLQERQKRDDPDGRLAFALGYVFKKRGAYEMAAQAYEEALAKQYRVAATHTNLGNVYFAQGAFSSAIKAYQKSISIQPYLFEAHFNLARAYYEVKDVQRGTDSFAKASEINRRALSFFEERKSPHPNRLIVDVQIPQKEILLQLFKPSPLKKDVYAAYWQRAMGSILSPEFLPLVAGMVLIGYFALLTLGAYGSFPQRCVRCAAPACQWCYASPKHTDHCSQCMNIFHRKESIDPLARAAKEREVLDYKEHFRRWARFVSFLFPGGGHLLLGYAWRGFIFLVVTMMFWFWFLYPGGVFPEVALASSHLWRGLRLAALGMGAGTFYFLIQRSVFQE